MGIEIKNIEDLFSNFKKRKPDNIETLPPSGSYRKYYRLKSGNKSYIGVYNEDSKENIAFLSFTKSFLRAGLNVPEILAEDVKNNVYILQDLGDVTLLEFLNSQENGTILSPESISVYKKVIEQLPVFQVKGKDIIDFSMCYPRSAFDRQSMMWDLNYFKYYFLKLAKIPFDEQKLENDFNTFCDYLLTADCKYFLYRDFQSRNVMICNNEPYFIDYQGGRRGALQYDIASILFEAKTSLNADVRQELLGHYISALSKHLKFDQQAFLDLYYGYVYIRLMQAMGAYGFRGLYEKKKLFMQSIPKAIMHLAWLRNNIKLPVPLPELEKVLDNLVISHQIKEMIDSNTNLTININSFSYKNGIPADKTANGGGFVFDCRALENPGKFEQYKNLNGKDLAVIKFIESNQESSEFIENIISIIDNAIKSYKKKNYSHLMVNFGCTGGQHRSVYTAEKLSEHLKTKYPEIKVSIKHRELEKKD
jgi:aminoglycoside/choline kinase family phosphotransferase